MACFRAGLLMANISARNTLTCAKATHQFGARWTSIQTNSLISKDVTVIEDSKLKKAITAAALGNAMEWFDFGVYGFVAATVGKVFWLRRPPSRLVPHSRPFPYLSSSAHWVGCFWCHGR
jgi:hypothetical protein